MKDKGCVWPLAIFCVPNVNGGKGVFGADMLIQSFNIFRILKTSYITIFAMLILTKFTIEYLRLKGPTERNITRTIHVWAGISGINILIWGLTQTLWKPLRKF